MASRAVAAPVPEVLVVAVAVAKFVAPAFVVPLAARGDGRGRGYRCGRRRKAAAQGQQNCVDDLMHRLKYN